MKGFGILLSVFAVVASETSTRNHRRALPLTIPFYENTAGGYSSAARGWNSWGIQSNPRTNPSFIFNQEKVLEQCVQLRPIPGHDYVCSLDSDWSAGSNGDEFGRIIPNDRFRNISLVADILHSFGLKFGIYVLPGAFYNDRDKMVFNTNIQIGSLFNVTDDPTGQTCNWFHARNNFDYTKDGVREWHESVVNLFASWKVDFIKLDFITPGSPQGGCLPYDSSASVKFYHEAIEKSGRQIRLDLSWKLDRTGALWDLWQNNADSLRTDQDINNADRATFVDWEVVQRAINHYRLYINEQIFRNNGPIRVRPDMDNMYVGNPAGITGLTDTQRYSVAIHWIGAGSNLITGSDLSSIDALGEELLYNNEAMEIAEFASKWPMQPRNPEQSGATIPGSNEAKQLQAWIAGPNENGEVVLVLANYGPDLGQGGFNTRYTGIHNVNITLNDLGIGGDMPGGSREWSIRRVWGGGGSGGEDHTGPWTITSGVECNLGSGESVLYRLRKME